MQDKLKLIGQTAQIKEKELLIDIEIIDFKQSWGKNRYLITPIAGSGEIWVENIILKT